MPIPPTIPATSPVRIQDRWFEEVWNQGREATIDELLAPDVTAHGLTDADGNAVHGREAFRVFYKNFRAIFSDIHITIEHSINEGDLGVARYVVTARHTGDGLGKPARGNPVKFTGMTMMRVQNGQVVESWNNIDFMAMYQQME